MSDELVAEAATYTTAHNKNKRHISMPSSGFKPMIPAVRQLQTLNLRPHGHWDM
jgi:hypothetical protein